MMKKNVISLIAAALLLAGLTACKAKTPQDLASDALNLDLSSGSEVSSYDTHSGNGDGTSCIVLSFQDDTVLEQIQAGDAWHPLPVDQTTQVLVYGLLEETSDASRQIGPFLTDDSGDPLVPAIQNGYYFLLDRQAKDGKAPGSDILDRGSFNFTFGLYDTDTDTLYCCELDT